jgi:class 3 adenylate cyclase
MLHPAAGRRTQLQPGDTLIRIGSEDLRGRGQYGVLTAMAAAGTGAIRAVDVVVQRGGRRLAVQEPMPLRVSSRYLADMLVSLISGTAAILILLRARPSFASRAMFQALVVDALLYVGQPGMPPPWSTLTLVTGGLCVVLTTPLLIRAIMAFPEEAHGLVGRWKWLPWPLSLVGIAIFSANNGFPLSPVAGEELSRVGLLLFVSIFLFALTRNYRRSGPAGKRQVKWLMYSFYIASLLTIPVLSSVDVAAVDQPLWATGILVLSKAAFPVTVLIASLRFDLLDIDRLFGATVLYNVLAAIALGAGFLVVPRTADALTAGLDIGRPMAQTILTIGLAALVLLAGRRLRFVVERLFFRERYALEAAMRELPERFAAVRRAEALWELAGGQLASILNPASLVIFASAGHSFVPVYAGAESRPPMLPADAPLLAWARALTGAGRIAKRDRARIGAMGAALLEDLDSHVIIPVHRNGALEALICLGEKRSGDIYTPTDLALLTAIGKTLSSHMVRFDEAELLERAQTLQQRMRRYVPGALAEVLAEGAELETGEREVSVLFVDIRGYTAYSHGRDAREIFSTVNRYTEAVSSIVREEGGVVVEFNGDGMMAVFGAPRPLADKEAAAVRAGVRLATEVPSLAAEEGTLAVGVGVATGPAFVGNIEAVDRTIWSAIGNTTNLAARLQSLTRTVAAAVLLDERTWTRAGDHGRAFTRMDDVAIRGRAVPETLFALSLPMAAMSPAPGAADRAVAAVPR